MAPVEAECGRAGREGRTDRAGVGVWGLPEGRQDRAAVEYHLDA